MLEASKVIGWARVWAAVRPPHSRGLRAGAWYPVVRDQLPDRVTILMGEREIDAPRRLFEIRSRRPMHFTVVRRVGYRPHPPRESLHRLGKHYAVCPVCQWRFGLMGTPEMTHCPHCGHIAQVGWWE